MDTLPFIDYYNEVKDGYPYAVDQGYIDVDNDFLIGGSGGFLMNMSFLFVRTAEFSKVADYFKEHKIYTHAKKGTSSYNEFWIRETKRRKEGLTLNCKLLKTDIDKYHNAKDEDKAKYLRPLHITGDHYNYLNYGRILRTPTDEEREELIRNGDSKAELIPGFPRFWDGDYWNFKVDEFIAKNKYHLCKAKARGKGYSFKRGSQGANTLNLYPRTTIVLAAYEEKYLTDPGATSDMLKANLDWYENNTYWHRGFITEDLKKLELGFKGQSTGHKKRGWLSKALSVTVNTNPGAAAGKRALEIDIEEAGYCVNLDQVLRVTTSSTEVGSRNVGTIRIYGTAGAKDADWQKFSNIFYTPHANFMMPFENVWDDNSRHCVCGFFHPQVLNYEPFMDEDGNSLLAEAYEDDLKKKTQAEKNKNTEDYLHFIAQRANKPSEAFGLGKENIFSSPELNNHVIRLQSDPNKKYYIDGMPVMSEKGVEFKSNKQLELEGNIVHSFIENVPIRPGDDPVGCTRVFYRPYVDRVTGLIPNNLYYAAYDTIGKDKKTKEFMVKNSLNCIGIWTYPNNFYGVPSDTLVARYIGRQEQMTDCNRLLDLLTDMYNCKALVEVDRGTCVEDFRRWHKLWKLYKNPTGLIDEKSNAELGSDYGIVIGAGDRKEDGLLYLKDWMYTPIGIDNDTGQTIYMLNTIDDLPLCLELQRFSSEGNYDGISMAIVARYQAKAFRAQRKKPEVQKKVSLFDTIGLYGFHK